MLKTFWKSPCKKVGIILKSGKEVVILCKKFTWTLVGNEINSYKIEGMKGASASYIKIEEIAAIVTYEN